MFEDLPPKINISIKIDVAKFLLTDVHINVMYTWTFFFVFNAATEFLNYDYQSHTFIPLYYIPYYLFKGAMQVYADFTRPHQISLPFTPNLISSVFPVWGFHCWLGTSKWWLACNYKANWSNFTNYARFMSL